MRGDGKNDYSYKPSDKQTSAGKRMTVQLDSDSSNHDHGTTMTFHCVSPTVATTVGTNSWEALEKVVVGTATIYRTPSKHGEILSMDGYKAECQKYGVHRRLCWPS